MINLTPLFQRYGLDRSTSAAWRADVCQLGGVWSHGLCKSPVKHGSRFKNIKYRYYRILFPVFIRTHCGMGRFCFCFRPSLRLMMNVLWAAWNSTAIHAISNRCRNDCRLHTGKCLNTHINSHTCTNQQSETKPLNCHCSSLNLTWIKSTSLCKFLFRIIGILGLGLAARDGVKDSSTMPLLRLVRRKVAVKQSYALRSVRLL